MTDPQFDLTRIAQVLDVMLKRIESIEKQSGPGAIANERYLHHLFSWEIGQAMQARNSDAWDMLMIKPEHPTKAKLNPQEARTKGVKPRSGNLDFFIDPGEKIYVEWKGPKVTSKEELRKAFVKLLTQEPEPSKVFAGFYLSGRTGRQDHTDAVKDRVRDALKEAQQSDEVADDCSLEKLHIYTATMQSGGFVKMLWGPASQV